MGKVLDPRQGSALHVGRVADMWSGTEWERHAAFVYRCQREPGAGCRTGERPRERPQV